MTNITDEQYREYLILKEKEDKKVNQTKFLEEIKKFISTKVREEHNMADSLQDFYYCICTCCHKSNEYAENIDHHEGCNYGEKIRSLMQKYDIKKCNAYNIIKNISSETDFDIIKIVESINPDVKNEMKIDIKSLLTKDYRNNDCNILIRDINNFYKIIVGIDKLIELKIPYIRIPSSNFDNDMHKEQNQTFNTNCDNMKNIIGISFNKKEWGICTKYYCLSIDDWYMCDDCPIARSGNCCEYDGSHFYKTVNVLSWQELKENIEKYTIQTFGKAIEYAEVNHKSFNFDYGIRVYKE